MKPKTIYLALCIAGAILPYWQFVPWLVDHGLNIKLLVQELFINRISAFFGMDVIVSSVALIAFMRVERTRLPMPMWWVPLAGVLLVGVSLGLPLFLYMREQALETRTARA